MKLTPPRPVTPNFDRATTHPYVKAVYFDVASDLMAESMELGFRIMAADGWAENFIAPHQPPAT